MSSAPRFTCCASDACVLRALLLAVATIGGCTVPPNGATNDATRAGLSPVLQRMRDTYEDLATGRFISLADFESRGQDKLFRVVGPNGEVGERPQPTLSILRSRNETGAGSLKVRIESAADEVRFDGVRSDSLALTRDWRGQYLLIMNVYGPQNGALLKFSIHSGATDDKRWERTLPVQPGWNLYRFDLATVGESIDLGDVRSLRWTAAEWSEPLDLYFDDLIVADNTKHVLGKTAQAGELYVFSRGRRVHVGARERFELEFLDGLITGWRDDSGQNLVDAGGLGPWPIPLSATWADEGQSAIVYDDPALFEAWGASVIATQGIAEVGPFRVVLVGRWRFLGEGVTSAPDQAAGHTWRYTIYPSGAVYTRITSVAPATGWGVPRVGYALGLSGRHGFRRVAERPIAAGEEPTRFVLFSRVGEGEADLLWTWTAAVALEQVQTLGSVDEARLAAIVGDLPAEASVETAHMLRFWPTDLNGAPEAHSLAADYRRPAIVVASTGRPRTDAAGDLDGNGYNESAGCYELETEDDVLRFTLAPGRLPRFDTVFRVCGTAGKDAWVYARGRLIQTVGRDADDNLLFRTDHAITTPLAVEVHTTDR